MKTTEPSDELVMVSELEVAAFLCLHDLGKLPDNEKTVALVEKLKAQVGETGLDFEDFVDQVVARAEARLGDPSRGYEVGPTRPRRSGGGPSRVRCGPARRSP